MQINLDDNYVRPALPLTDEQYADFVMNMAAESYMKQYNVATKAEGLAAARAVYNTVNTQEE